MGRRDPYCIFRATSETIRHEPGRTRRGPGSGTPLPTKRRPALAHRGTATFHARTELVNLMSTMSVHTPIRATARA